MNEGDKVLQAPGAPEIYGVPLNTVGIVKDERIQHLEMAEIQVFVEWQTKGSPALWLRRDYVVPLCANSILDAMVSP